MHLANWIVLAIVLVAGVVLGRLWRPSNPARANDDVPWPETRAQYWWSISILGGVMLLGVLVVLFGR